MEFPVFEFPLHDTTASAGADVLLKCIIAGAPTPEGKQVHLMFPQMESSYYERFGFIFFIFFLFFVSVTWTKDNKSVTSVANYTVKVEGERHSLLIKSAKTTDGGKYCVTAVNQVGKASSSATLTVKAGKFDSCHITHSLLV